MGSKFYGKLLPDYGDILNTTGTAPGYRVYIVENDGGVSLSMIHADDDPVTSSGSEVFMNVDEAKELYESLREAILRAAGKSAKHKPRGSDC